MAKTKSIKTNTGFDASHWIAAELGLNFLGKGGKLVVAGYKDAEARQSGCVPIGQMVIDLPESVYAEMEKACKKIAVAFFDGYKSGPFAEDEEKPGPRALPVAAGDE